MKKFQTPYQTILFDLDGTLIDSYKGIAGGVSFALEKMGIEEPPASLLRRFIGPPLGESFLKHCGMTPEQVREAVTHYREYYSQQGLFEVTVYEGIPEMLMGLKAAGYTLAVATSKPQPFALRILESLELAGYFKVIAGSGLDGSLGTKREVIAHCLTELGIEDSGKSAVLMVGDREHDVHGAGALNIDCLGVLYGFGSTEELETAGAVGLAETAVEVLRFLGLSEGK